MTRDEVRAVIAPELFIEPEKATDDATELSAEGADWLDLICAICAVERQFGVEIVDDFTMSFVTVGDFLNYVMTQAVPA